MKKIDVNPEKFAEFLIELLKPWKKQYDRWKRMVASRKGPPIDEPPIVDLPAEEYKKLRELHGYILKLLMLEVITLKDFNFIICAKIGITEENKIIFQRNPREKRHVSEGRFPLIIFPFVKTL